MEYNTENIRYISHEVKNQLSVCDLYAEILIKYCTKNNISDETILKSAQSIKNSLQLAGNSLLELKSIATQNINNYSINEILSETYNMSKVYGINKSINIELVPLNEELSLSLDKEKFQGVLINLVKNACEAFTDESSKTIIISTEKTKNYFLIKVRNNAQPIKNPKEIFNDGFTTKSTGSGIGLFISKKNMEDMSGYLKLNKSDNEYTEFEIGLKL